MQSKFGTGVHSAWHFHREGSHEGFLQAKGSYLYHLSKAQNETMEKKSNSNAHTTQKQRPQSVIGDNAVCHKTILQLLTEILSGKQREGKCTRTHTGRYVPLQGIREGK